MDVDGGRFLWCYSMVLRNKDFPSLLYSGRLEATNQLLFEELDTPCEHFFIEQPECHLVYNTWEESTWFLPSLHLPTVCTTCQGAGFDIKDDKQATVEFCLFSFLHYQGR